MKPLFFHVSSSTTQSQLVEIISEEIFLVFFFENIKFLPNFPGPIFISCPKSIRDPRLELLGYFFINDHTCFSAKNKKLLACLVCLFCFEISREGVLYAFWGYSLMPHCMRKPHYNNLPHYARPLVPTPLPKWK